MVTAANLASLELEVWRCLLVSSGSLLISARAQAQLCFMSLETGSLFDGSPEPIKSERRACMGSL